MKHLVTAAIVILMVCTVFLASGRNASACKCAIYQTQAVLPVDGATDVPINTRIWLSNGSTGYNQHVLLLTRERTVISLSRSVIVTLNGTLHILTPDASLLPDEQYEVGKYVYDQYYGPFTSFTTGSHIDTTPTEPPMEVDRISTSWNTCGSLCTPKGSEVKIQLSGEGLLLVDIGNSQTLDTVQHDGFVSTITSDGTIVLGGSRGGCGGPWPGARGESLSIRYGSFDLAGNFSGWTEESTVTMPKIPATCSCNCTTSSSRENAAVALLVLGLLMLLRRRRRVG